MNKKLLISGGVFGLIAPIIGMFFGLQVSTVLGTIFAFPVIALVYVTGQPFGYWGGGMMVLAFALSAVAWALIFWLVGKFVFKK